MSLGAMAASAEDLSEEDVKRLALEAILENPDIVMQAVEILRQRDEQAKAEGAKTVLDQQRDLLERDPNAPVIGNPDGDVTVVEFFDYNCPYCKRAAPIVKGVIAGDGNVRVVYREWPILGEGSVFAARAALAARNQGKYEEFHWALMGLNGRANEASVMKAARALGLDENKLRADMNAPEVDAHIQVSMDLARGLGFTGTPSFVIGDALAPGLIEQAQMEQLISTVREDR
ncbi:DsbA family protein [Ruegeria sp. B32]|uniref:DsbA family protein n=1 Tax=Ruegeria sp. B32 TaxID=2867020 RepID=UPI0021A80722|nr:DsbA family protein [Ruegeria sp. B32]UWR09581.1 DsbA family protein [Ruegeria sp. B32]